MKEERERERESRKREQAKELYRRRKCQNCEQLPEGIFKNLGFCILPSKVVSDTPFLGCLWTVFWLKLCRTFDL